MRKEIIYNYLLLSSFFVNGRRRLGIRHSSGSDSKKNAAVTGPVSLSVHTIRTKAYRVLEIVEGSVICVNPLAKLERYHEVEKETGT